MTRVLILAALAALAWSAPAAAAERLGHRDRSTLERYAADTWRSFDMLLEPDTGLPADNVSAEGARSEYTSPTNVATYLWSTLAARDLRLIDRRDATARMRRTLTTLASMERHADSGMFFNWYDPGTGERLDTWPLEPHNHVYPFLSSVDNGWLAAALVMVARADPELRAQAGRIERGMHFGFFYDPQVGQLRGGAWTEQPPDCSVAQDGVYYTCHHYGTLNTEPRIASYLGIAQREVPAEHYFRMFRTFPETCDWSWQETRPEGVTRRYMGVDVYEGHYRYRGMNVVPSWGGSMFEALMVPLLVPEEQWGPRSWGVNHPLMVRSQIAHGLQEARYGYWGFSPSNNPDGGYREYGVDAIGLNPDGYASDQDRTLVDHGFGDCRPPAPPDPPPSAYVDGVVTPHASFLALDFDRRAALANLANIERDFAAYGPGGFYDAIRVDTGKVSRFYLALDQGMIMAAAANELDGDRLQSYIAPRLERSVRPLLKMERFTAGRAGG